VFVGGRSEESAKAAIKRLGASGASTSKAVPWVASLSTIAEAAAAGKALVDAKVPLHALVLNAGIMAVPERRVTADNLEMMMAVNHVAHAALARAAHPALTAASACEKPRLVVVSSAAHQAASPSFVDSPVLEGSSYGPWATYGDSKMANILFARGAAQHWPDVTSVSLHPGAILTNLSRHTDGVSAAAFDLLVTLRDYNVHLFKTVSQGAATTLYALIAPEVAGLSGAYFENAHQAQPSALYMDAAKAEYASTLWSTTWKVVDKVLAKK
jgi:NAD(P)-dependent dehydrogenase (short-subunit alcohol dehydrogenase family)